MERLALYIAVSILGYFIIYIVLKKKIEKYIDPSSLLDQIREEVNRIIVELNQTTDRNIALIEDRISRLMELLAKADKKISLLQREGEKHEVSRKIYNNITRSKAEKQYEPEPDERRDRQDEVLRLHQVGFSAPIIAKRVGTPLGEVELIISLSEKKQ